MSDHAAAIVLLAYMSLAAELAFIRVSSVASSLSIWRADASLVAGYSTKHRKKFTGGKGAKLLLAAPLVVIYAVHAFPLIVIGLDKPDPVGDYLFAPAYGTEETGIALVVIGRVLTIVSALSLRRRHRPAAGPVALEISGPFRWSRNPGLVGMYLFVGGVWLTMPSASLAAGIAVYALHMDHKVRMEEDFLENTFGRRYAEYRARTRRYLL